jgi:hypothetical protein
MQRRMRVCVFVVAMSMVACRTAMPPKQSAPPPAEVTQLQGTESKAAALTASLCDSAGARLSGSPGEARGVAWAVETMKSLGFDNVHTEPVLVSHWVRGAETAKVTLPFEQPLTIVGLGHTVPTPEGGVEAEVVEVESFDALTALKPGALTGKILFVNIPMRRANDGAGYSAVAKVRGLAGLHGLAAGAAAVLIRSVGTDVTRVGHTGWQSATPAKIPAAALSVPDAELVHRLLQKGAPVRIALSLSSREEAPVESFNVVGELSGREKPQEVVLLGAHLDSWDLGTGALDDGAGVGIVLDAVRLIGTLARHPKRTVRVVLFANEENGLAGGKAYAKAHEAEFAQHVLAMEADSGTGAALAARVLASKEGHAQFMTWAPWLQPLGVPFQGDAAGGGADLIPLRAAGVPLLDVRQDASTYFDFHHTANDTVDKLEPIHQAQVARTYATLAWLAAEQEVDFGRTPKELRERK